MYLSNSNTCQTIWTDRPLNTHKPDRLFTHHQTAIAPQHTQPRSPFPQIKQRSPPQHLKPDRLFTHHQTAIAPHHPKPDHLFPQYQKAIAIF
ncbi:MAG: hypothetical protein WCQ26_09245 [Pseudanabaena sp. ELA748]